MNKIAKRIMTVAAALALVVVLGVCMTACGGDNKPTESLIETYRARFKNANYVVATAQNGALQAMLENMDTEEGMPEDVANVIQIDSIEWVLCAVKGQDMDTATIVVKLTNQEIAKYMETFLIEYKKQMEKELEQPEQTEVVPQDEEYVGDIDMGEMNEMMNYLGGILTKSSIVRDGSVILFGQQVSINIALGK